MKLPEIGFGTWQILMNGKAKKVVTEALLNGYRLIDTAMIYGNEKGVGAAVRDSGTPRDQIYLTTKLWNFDQGYEKALAAFNTSLKRLDVTYVDLYLIHWPQNEQLTKDSWRAMEEIHGLGLAKNIGVSNFDVDQLKNLLSYAKVKPAVNQIEFHPFIYKDKLPILTYCNQHGIAVEAYSPLARGKAVTDPLITKLAKETGRTNGQIMIRWAMQHGTVPLPKTTHVERMQENINVFDFELSESQMEQLNNLSSGKSYL